MRHLLERPEGRPDAVFGGSDTMAVGATRAIAEAGLSVPDDVAVMGFDGLSVHTRNYPGLSTLQQSIPNLGRTAVELLLKRIAEPGWAGRRTSTWARRSVRAARADAVKQPGRM